MTMRAILLHSPGGADQLRLGEVPSPGISEPREIKIRVKAAGINPVDTKLRQRGTYFPGQMPAILGCDGAGVVVAVGPEVQDYAPGDPVYYCYGGIGRPPGSYGEYVVLDERCVAPKPRSLSFPEAAAAPLVLITAWESLFHRARVTEGERLLIHGGAGGVGHVAIQLARLWGGRVATTARQENHEFVRELGAELAIDYREEPFVTAVEEWTGGQGVSLVLDTVGGSVMRESIRALETYGTLVTLLQPDNEMDWKEARLRNLSVALELMLTPMLRDDMALLSRQAAILRECATLFDGGRLRIQVAETLPLEQAAEAHRLLEAGGLRGKVVLLVDESAT